MTSYRSLFSLALLVGAVSACGGGGPIDGNWKIDSLTCNGTAAPTGAAITVNINNTAGTFVIVASPTCTATTTETYSYPSGNTIAITPQSVACNPNSGCAAVFGGASCSPLSPNTSFTYVLSGNKLTFTRTATANDPCPAGQTVVFSMSKQ